MQNVLPETAFFVVESTVFALVVLSFLPSLERMITAPNTTAAMTAKASANCGTLIVGCGNWKGGIDVTVVGLEE